MTRYRVSAALGVSALFLLMTMATMPVAAGGGGPAVFTVGFYDAPPVAEGARLHGASVLTVNDAIDFVTVRAGDAEAFQLRAQSDGRIRYIERDLPMMAFAAPNDPYYSNQWDFQSSFPGMDAEGAWAVTMGSTAVTVAILDTGIDTDHPDLPAATGADFTGGNTIEDCQGHGTHVAGTVAAKTGNGIGVAGTSQSSLLIGRVLDCNGSGSFSWLANSITWAVDSGADVLSMSLGCSARGCFHQATSDALQYAADNGVLSVCAAGNSGPKKNSVEFPGNDPNCMAVSNVGNGFLASSSSTGPEVEIAAQGSDILSTYVGGGYASLTGTSMAAPHVSGVAALVKAVNPAFTGQDLKDILKASAVDSSLDAKQEGSGILNAAGAVSLAQTWTPGGGSSGGGGDTGGGGSEGFTLTLDGYKVKGSKVIDLTWAGASSATVDIYRDGSLLLAGTANDGFESDAIGGKGGGSYQYQVCEASTAVCTDLVTWTF